MSDVGSLYTKTVLVNGQPTVIRCFDFEGSTLKVSGFPLRTVTIEDEWFDQLVHPQDLIRELQAHHATRADLLQFWNPIPYTEPRHDLPFEQKEIAVLPVSTYAEWWQNRIKSRTRNLIRKSEKEGLEVRQTEFDDQFVTGMSQIFNECPIRQGRRFWHYGKGPEAVRKHFSRFLCRETMIGAYYRGELVGFIMLGSAGECAHLGQILSRLDARELNPNNALVAKAVEICASRSQRYLVYGFWGDTTLAEFKRRCGFESLAVPRYVVPLSAIGRLAIRLGLHHGMRGAIPPKWRANLRDVRSKLYRLRNV